MTTPDTPDQVQAIVDLMVARLIELQATGETELIHRRITTTDGLTGGGDLTQNREIGLDQDTRNALARATESVSAATLDDTLQGYVSREFLDQTLRSYVLSRENTKAWTLPFSHSGQITFPVQAPPAVAVTAGQIRAVGIAAIATPQPVDVVINGARFRLNAGSTTVLHTATIDVARGGPINLTVESQNATGVTVTLRVVEP